MPEIEIKNMARNLLYYTLEVSVEYQYFVFCLIANLMGQGPQMMELVSESFNLW